MLACGQVRQTRRPPLARSAVRKEGDLVMARFPFFLLCVLVRKRCISGRVLDFGWYFGKKF